MSCPNSGFTSVRGISSAGTIVGACFLSGIRHGYILNNGVYTIIDFPGSTNDIAFGVNAAGVIVGSYDDSNGATHGFVMHP